MDKRDLVTLAREDFQHQQSVDDGVAARLRFLLTAVTLVASASMGLAGIGVRAHSGGELLLVMTMVVLWTAVATVVAFALLAYRSQKWTDPHTLDEYIRWARERAHYLEEKGFDEVTSREIARDDMVDQIIAVYASAAAANRQINQRRMRELARARFALIVAAFILGAQSLIVVIYQ